jgi:hypothetical protein
MGRYSGSGPRSPSEAGDRTSPYLAPFQGGVILNSFDDRAPLWMFDSVKISNLRQTPVCSLPASTRNFSIARRAA